MVLYKFGPRRPTNYANRAHAKLGAGKLDDAIKDCDRALKVAVESNVAAEARSSLDKLTGRA